MIQKLLESGLHWEKKEFRRNDFLKLSGSADTQIYFIEKGSVRIFMTDENEERIIRFGYTGNIITSMDSFLSGKPSDLCIQAIKKTTVKTASKKDFSEFIQKNDNNLHFWINILEDLVLQQLEREKDLLISSPGERFERVLKRSPKLFQEIPNKYIANYLRMSPETLSRLKKS
ncbi:Crp/Fnr family transcriptional regulator [Chryseobacterium sp. BLS98]|jgi:CRP-like cAMP-binding protein|uniref:Crp/Fnr family transcriptional regulator n=1 Tax=Chryseobacterium sp. BLS98 TaxID=885586 RepID=UPI00065AB984|nr:Crp/Fnr family transcriptional regulator [Chryseobacterium sp. BLS98]KMQ61122.1 Crp/Fnr family transcriptional regulator [Chryseobacterium sp. BLS98]